MRTRPLGVAVLAALAACAPVASAWAGGASFQGLGDLPGGIFSSVAQGVSGDGATVVGHSQSAFGSQTYEAFRWTEGGGMVGLGDLAGTTPRSIAYAASGDGGVIVGMARGGPHDRRPFRWTAATGMVALDDSASGFFGGQAFDVTPDGTVIVGVGIRAAANEAFRWTQGGGMAGLGFLAADDDDSFAFGVSDDGAVVCGLSNAGSSGVRATRWTAATGLVSLGDVPGGVDYAIAYDVSGDGSVIAGVARATIGTDEAFLWTAADSFRLVDPAHGAEFSTAFHAIGGGGTIAGGYHGATGALVWDEAHGLRDLTTLLEVEHGLSLAGWLLGAITGISDDGTTIVGSGVNPAGATEGWIARLPATVDVAPARNVSARSLVIASAAHPARGRVRFGLAGTALRGMAPDLEVIAVDGRRVALLGTEPGNTWSWEGRLATGGLAADGIYFARVRLGDGAVSRRFAWLR